MSKRICGLLCNLGSALVAGALFVAVPCAAQQLTNDELSLTVNAQEGSYQLSLHDGQPVLSSRVAAQVDHQWLRSSDYPRHQASESTFEDDLGSGRAGDSHLQRTGRQTRSGLRATALQTAPLRHRPGKSAKQRGKGSNCAGHSECGGHR